MAVTILETRRIGPLSWRLRWSSDQETPEYRVYQDGVLMGVTTAEEMDFTVDVGESLAVEVFDDTTSSSAVTSSPRVLIGWYAPEPGEEEPVATAWRIERWVSNAWQLQATLAAEGVRMTWLSPSLPSGLHRFRLTPTDALGVKGRSFEQEVMVIRRPGPPDAFTVEVEGGAVTVE